VCQHNKEENERKTNLVEGYQGSTNSHASPHYWWVQWHTTIQVIFPRMVATHHRESQLNLRQILSYINSFWRSISTHNALICFFSKWFVLHHWSCWFTFVEWIVLRYQFYVWMFYVGFVNLQWFMWFVNLMWGYGFLFFIKKNILDEFSKRIRIFYINININKNIYFLYQKIDHRMIHF